MKPTAITHLVALCVFVALATLIVQVKYFSVLPRSWWDLIFPWLLAVVCAAGAKWVRSVLSDDRIGQDRSQVQPTVLAGWLIVGTSSAWLGAVLAGYYLGGLMWAIPNWAEIAVAQDEGPVMIVGVVSGVLLSAAGLWLEKECQLPPDDGNSERPPVDGVPPTVGWEV